MSHLIFVYGTLKRGGSNHALLSGQRFVGTGRTRPLYKLYLLDGYPGMVAAERGGCSIEGEIWAVDRECLDRLDQLEGVDVGLYERVQIPLLPPHDTLSVEGYLHLQSISGRTELGDHWPV